VEVIYQNSSNLIEAQEVTNGATGAYENEATVTVTLLDEETETEINGQSWPAPMPYVAGSDGVYRATLSRNLVLAGSQRLIARVVVDGGAGLYREFETPCIVIFSE
jgi:hypothetical protein